MGFFVRTYFRTFNDIILLHNNVFIMFFIHFVVVYIISTDIKNGKKRIYYVSSSYVLAVSS